MEEKSDLTPTTAGEPSMKTTSFLKKARDSHGRKVINQYVFVEEIGEGTYSKVKKCFDTEKCVYRAMKIMDKHRLHRKYIGEGKTALQDVMREVEILGGLSHHPNIITLYEVIDDKPAAPTGKMYLIFDYVDGGPMMDGDDEVMHPVSESVARVWFSHICSGLHFLHANKIAHRDLKPENLLVSVDGVVKIADFSVADTFESADGSCRTVGTPAFWAPEICSGDHYRAALTDIWAIGITLYMMIYGTVPFQASNLMQLSDRIQNQDLEFPTEPRGVSEDLKLLLLGILDKDPNCRMSLIDIMSHQWMTGEEGKVTRSPSDM
ncbi:hypothetical protein CBR_g17887 [Chara braunii]|uniref:Protein kinase domain-containing protein n=1 Tax=Chara braunii TaxID=69332 RepID=A0A388KW47_CHABU|nr:hypothetical protein CBR_g17887 [Chara braunii]|eukprot:GBG74173.1 hypothetical protein CBR_g17887 [Chara braunii]